MWHLLYEILNMGCHKTFSSDSIWVHQDRHYGGFGWGISFQTLKTLLGKIALSVLIFHLAWRKINLNVWKLIRGIFLSWREANFYEVSELSWTTGGSIPGKINVPTLSYCNKYQCQRFIFKTKFGKFITNRTPNNFCKYNTL